MEQVAEPCGGGTGLPQIIKFLRRKLRQKSSISKTITKSRRYILADSRFHT